MWKDQECNVKMRMPGVVFNCWWTIRPEGRSFFSASPSWPPWSRDSCLRASSGTDYAPVGDCLVWWFCGLWTCAAWWMRCLADRVVAFWWRNLHTRPSYEGFHVQTTVVVLPETTVLLTLMMMIQTLPCLLLLSGPWEILRTPKFYLCKDHPNFFLLKSPLLNHSLWVGH